MFPGLGILLCNTFGVWVYLPLLKELARNPAIFPLLDLSVGETDRNWVNENSVFIMVNNTPSGVRIS